MGANPAVHLFAGIACIGQPQTNGVAQRFIRTLKEQVISGRVFQNRQEARDALRRLVDSCHREWLVEKTAFKAPGRPEPNGRHRTLPERLKKNLCPENRLRYISSAPESWRLSAP